MSAETKAALDAALQAHVADEAGRAVIVTGYALAASFAGAEDFSDSVTRYHHEYAEGQPFHAAFGLVAMHRLILEEKFSE